MLTIALALPGTGTSEARIDPTRYGKRAVNAAGGSATTVAVRFTVRPVVVLVVDGRGRATELWTNLPGRPDADRPPRLLARAGSAGGRDLTLTPPLRAAAAAAIADAGWGHQGLIWSRTADPT